MRIKFWGVRGSIAAPGKEFVDYGGNTTFITIDQVHGWGENEYLTLDFGSGAKDFSAELMHENKYTGLNLLCLFSHFHWDHISGFPFFVPVYQKNNYFRLFSNDKISLKRSIAMQSNGLNFPMNIEDVSANIEYNQISHCQRIYAPNVSDAVAQLQNTNQTSQMAFKGLIIDTLPLNHNQNCVGFRILEQRTFKTFVYITDHESNQYVDLALIKFISDSELVYMDGMYNEDNIQMFKGFGHSTWEECVGKFEKAENVEKMLIGHHNFTSTDSHLKEIDKTLSKKFKKKQVELAKERMVIELK